MASCRTRLTSGQGSPSPTRCGQTRKASSGSGPVEHQDANAMAATGSVCGGAPEALRSDDAALVEEMLAMAGETYWVALEERSPAPAIAIG